MHEGHRHSAAYKNAARLKWVLALTAPLTAAEVIGGYLTGSLVLIADAGHMLADVFGVSMALVAITLAARPATRSKTYGYHRLEILAAFVNGLILIGVAGYIIWEAYHRMAEPPEIDGWFMLGIATAGLVVNAVCGLLLFEGQKTSLNMRAAFLEVVSDMLGSLAAVVAGIVILTTGFARVDPIASLLIGLFILPRTWRLMSEALHVLLEGAPREVNVDHIRDHILGTENVVGVHDLHVWSMTSGMPVMTAHVVIEEGAAAARVLDDLCACLSDHFDIEHSTIQIERSDRSAREPSVH